MSYILLLASFVPLVFMKDIAVYLFSKLSNFWGYQAPGRRPNAVGSGQFAASLQCWVTTAGPVPADLTSPGWPWESPDSQDLHCDGIL